MKFFRNVILMPKFPTDAPTDKVTKTVENLGFPPIREGSHSSVLRENSDGTRTPLIMPNYCKIKSSTLHTIPTQSVILRDEFLAIYRKL